MGHLHIGLKAAVAAISLSVSGQAFGQAMITPEFAANYALTSLGSVPDVPVSYGGLTFLDNDTLLIGGAANLSSAAIYSSPVTRDSNGHITGFGAATLYATAQGGGTGGIDGGLSFGPGGVLFYTSFNDNYIGQIKPGSTGPDKLVDLTALGVNASVGTLTFVPAGQPGEGRLKILSYGGNDLYNAALTPDGNGTFNVSITSSIPAFTNGPEGMIYVPLGSDLFAAPSVLISEFLGGRVAAFDVDAIGDPIPATRRDFITGLTGAEGAVIDPLTGDFLFSTFGGGNQVIRVTGFEVIPEPGSMGVAAIAGLALLVRRRS